MNDFEKKEENPSGEFRLNEFASQEQFPQFGKGANFEDIQQRIEAAKSNGWGAQITRFLATNKKRVFVLAMIVALFAFGSYFSNRSAENELNVAGISESLVGETQNSNENLPSTDADLGIQLGKDGTVVTAEEVEQRQEEQATEKESGSLFSQISEKLAQADTNQENAQPSGDVITKTAQPKEGVTHLARHALRDYLNQTGKSLSAEQKIYAEDYVQNKTGSELLEVDQQLSFSKDLLKEAVEKAEKLSDSQVENLKQYTANVSLL